ncbi:cupin domain-containing protein [Rhodococcus erythropolis]|uniref:cupin domain-containing protein n=1 Tax=Rhodococcus erythropolis TaxID=1833 RepID=UPI003D0E383F
MRRVVTVEVDGRSKIALNEEVSAGSYYQEIWAHDDVDQLGSDPGTEPHATVPAPGQTRFRMVSVPPHSEVQAEVAEIVARGEDVRLVMETDEEGWHRTETLDYVYVLDGPVELLVDDESVVMEPGDTVVQRSTNHAWRNHGDEPIRLLVFMAALR